jgi:transcriptional regulator with PAS, ATPase and Fis domain
VTQPGTLTLAAVERAHILSVVNASPSKIAAARALGINKRTLYRRLAEYEAEPTDMTRVPPAEDS